VLPWHTDRTRIAELALQILQQMGYWSRAGDGTGGRPGAYSRRTHGSPAAIRSPGAIAQRYGVVSPAPEAEA
jgi:hypothetical protein